MSIAIPQMHFSKVKVSYASRGHRKIDNRRQNEAFNTSGLRAIKRNIPRKSKKPNCKTIRYPDITSTYEIFV